MTSSQCHSSWSRAGWSPRPHCTCRAPDPPDGYGERGWRPRAWEVVVESGLLLLALAELLEHGAEAGDHALLDGAQRVAPVLVPGTLSSAAPLLVRSLGPAHWEGVQGTLTQTGSPGRAPSRSGLGPQPRHSPRTPRFGWICPHGWNGGPFLHVETVPTVWAHLPVPGGARNLRMEMCTPVCMSSWEYPAWSGFSNHVPACQPQRHLARGLASPDSTASPLTGWRLCPRQALLPCFPCDISLQMLPPTTEGRGPITVSTSETWPPEGDITCPKINSQRGAEPGWEPERGWL